MLFLVVALGVQGEFSYAQKKAKFGFQGVRLDFEDSIHFVCTNTRQVTPMAIGAAFRAQWSALSPKQQSTIKQQASALQKKGCPFPHFLHYYASLNAAGGSLDSFLETASHVIAKEDLRATELFFLNSSLFLKKRALNWTVLFKARANDVPFSFVYAERKAKRETADYSATTAANDVTRPVKVPPHEGPVIRFDAPVTLRFVSPQDSASLIDAKGTFSLIDKSFHGAGGRFDWSSTGIPADSTYYSFSEFSFNAASPVLKAQGGALFTGNLARSIPGVFEYNALPGSKEKGTYPRFTSYANNLRIGGFPPSIKYRGGFSLIGHYAKNYSVKGGLSTLEWSEQEGRKLTVRGRAFHINQKQGLIEGEDAAITIRHGKDSITHPSKAFKLDYERHTLLLLPNKSNMKKAPFISSLFGIDFNADELTWNAATDEVKLRISGGGKVSPLIFESNQYYNADDFRVLHGKGFRFHPLMLATRYAKASNQQTFYANELVPESKSDYQTVVMAMQFLAEKGMILFRPANGQITVSDKAMLWLEAVNKQADYDNLKIQSYHDKGANAVMSLKDNKLTVRGVDEFVVSDSLHVKISPDSSTLQFTPNRGFSFNGVLRSGVFEIYGKDFKFNYKEFYFDINKIDSIRLHIKRKGRTERVNNSLISLGSVKDKGSSALEKALEKASKASSGTLFIDHPSNKAGLRKYDTYPRFEQKGSSVVYFDKPEILQKAYDRSVHFLIPPFAVDSLEKTNSGNVEFKGTFVSDGILPDFEDELHTMIDRSLGFKHRIPPKGYKLYRTSGLLFGNLSLDTRGLRNKGKLQYLTTALLSDDFVLYRDSVSAVGKSGAVKEGLLHGTAFPHITFKEYKLRWLPKEDKMNIANGADPFELYKGLGTLNGSITVSEKLVGGEGRMKLPSCEIASKDFEFHTTQIKAEDARFKVFTENSKIPAMDAKHVSLEFDLAGEKAKIRPQVTGNLAFEFPLARFKTSISTAEWDLKAKKITMKAEGDIANSYFVTTKEELDSLRFNAEQAEYDIVKETLTLSGVPYITVADMRITPENRTFVVKKNAQFGVFKNVTLVADTANQYHKLTDGEVTILSRNTLRGFATYRYGNIVGDTFNIKMNEFELVPIDSSRRARREGRMQTSAKGEVPEAMNLRMSPRMLFKGTAIMYASAPKLSLYGYISPEIKGKTKKTWLKYSQTGAETYEAMSYDKAVSEKGKKPNAGIFFGKDGNPYPLFIADKKDVGDEAFFSPSGVLYFDEKTSEFKIEDSLKASGQSLSGQLFAYNDDQQTASFDGRLQFIPPYDNFQIKGSGIGKFNAESAKLSLNSLVIFDGKIAAAAMQLMADRLKRAAKEFDIHPGMGDHTQLLDKLGALLPEKTIKEYEQSALQKDVPLVSLPTLLKMLVLSNVDMLYSEKHKALYSTGMIGVSNIGKNDINGEFEGYFEVRRSEPSTAPEVHLFIKASGDAWFYFGLLDNKMLAFSSDPNFNNAIASKRTEARDRSIAVVPGTEEETEAFIARFRKDYLGLERAYHLADDMLELKSTLEKTEQQEEDLAGRANVARQQAAEKKKTEEVPKEKEKKLKKKKEKKKQDKPAEPAENLPPENLPAESPAPSDSTQTEPPKKKAEKKEEDGF